MGRHSILTQSARAASLCTSRQSFTRPAPVICNICLKATTTRTSRTRPLQNTSAQQRAFASTPRIYQEASNPTATPSPPPPQKETIAPQTHYDFFPQTFPNGPPPNSPFTPDLRQLRKEYLQSQAKTHPDLAPPDRKRQAEALSMRVNEAYKTLQDPLKRAQYLLASIHGIDVEDETAKLGENELLMEVMEAREAVDEVESEEGLVVLRRENNERIAESVDVLERAFAAGEADVAAQEAVRLRYWMNIEESIQGWEKGSGGGVLHH